MLHFMHMVNFNEDQYLNALNKISGIGAKRMQRLLNFFDSAQSAWNASQKHLEESGIGQAMAGKMVSERQFIDPSAEWDKLKKENVQLIAFNNPHYPFLLKDSPNPPYLLYLKSTFPSAESFFSEFNASPSVAIVGNRKNTAYGALVAQNLAKSLAEAGVTVVSGMALGIDSYAHRGAIAGNGKTIAVLGNGVDNESLYPKNNVNLAYEISQNGGLLSEYPLGTQAGPMTFPARNRIVAGLTLGTIVVEAGEKSGSLITSQMALEANREVFAVPGSIFSESSIGTHQLLRSGAKIVTGVKDILEELGLEGVNKKKNSPPKNPETNEEKILLKILTSEPLHIDNISKMAKLHTAVASSALSMMELKGWVKNIGGQNYIQI